MTGARALALGRPAAAVLASVVSVSVLIELLGSSAPTAWRALVRGAVGTPLNLGQTLMLASILSLTGLAAAIPFSARMWNVGAEGQLYAGAIAAVAVGLGLGSGTAPLLHVSATVVAGTAAGAAWGFVPGILKTRWGANEVITSLMLFFIANLSVNYASSSIWPSGLALSTRDLPSGALLPVLSSSTRVTFGVVLSVAAVAFAWVTMERGALGFQLRAAGLNEHAAELNGLPVAKLQVLSFSVGGAAAGLAGAILVAGMYGSLIAHAAAGFGFLGIAVALVARLSPTWIIPAALLFAGLRVGSKGLQVEAGISSSAGDIIVGVLVVALLAFGVVRLRYAEAVAA